MGYIIVGIIFLIGAASGDYVLKGTNSSGYLALAGVAILGVGVYRMANPKVRCQLCGASMSQAAFREHLRITHPAESSALRTMEDAEGRLAARERAASETFELIVLDPGPKPDKVIKRIMESFGIDSVTAEAGLNRPLRGGYATVEGARIAIEAVGARAQTREGQVPRGFGTGG